MQESALATLYVAADAIRALPNVAECTAENDNDSGEVIFTLTSGEIYALKLTQLISHHGPIQREDA